MSWQIKFFGILLWITAVIVLWLAFATKSANADDGRYSSHRISTIGDWYWQYELTPDVPGKFDEWYPSACGMFRKVCWDALVRAELPPLHYAPGQGNVYWIQIADRTVRGEGWHWWCVGLGCNGGRNPDGTLDRGIVAFNEYWRSDVPDSVAFNPVLAIQRMIYDWGQCINKNGNFCPRQWYGSKWK